MTESIEHLAALWSSLDELCADLTEEQWKTPTGCPGWTVQDQLSHLIDYEARAVGKPAPEHKAADVSHTKNDLGVTNEDGVDARRGLPGADVLAEFRSVTADRLAQLRALTPADLEREVTTPAGPGTVADMLTLRVMDTWSHEQDIRRAMGRPGNEDSPAADYAVDYFCRFLPIVVARRAEPADGDVVAFEIGARPPLVVSVRDGKGSVADGASDAGSVAPTVALRMPTGTFGALIGGRSDVDRGTVSVEGDQALGERVLSAIGFMP